MLAHPRVVDHWSTKRQRTEMVSRHLETSAKRQCTSWWSKASSGETEGRCAGVSVTGNGFI